MNIFAFQFLLIVNYCFHVDVDINPDVLSKWYKIQAEVSIVIALSSINNGHLKEAKVE